MLAIDRMNPSHPPVRAGWILRPAQPGDLAAVRSLLASCSLPVDGVADQFDAGYVVAEQAGAIVGVAGVERHGRYGLLRSVAVAPAWRSGGVGSALVLDRLQWSDETGLEALFLLTTDASRYFHRHGFRVAARESAPVEIQRSREFSEMCPSSAQLMRLHANAAELAAIRDAVRERYAKAARDVSQGGGGCCGDSCGCSHPITGDLYDVSQLAELPDTAVVASLGCGNPTLLAELREGETVLDLGSGGGIDVLLSARRVGPSGFAYGIDMTDEMLELARDNQRKAGVANVEFRKGEIESLPLPDAAVDVIISNCVINLSGDKARVIGEAFRVLKPGGRFAVSDIVVRREIPRAIRRSAELWAGCVAGALEEWTYRELLRTAGFIDIEIVPTRIYRREEATELASNAPLGPDDLAALDGAFMSAFVRATKPEGGVK